MASVGVVAAKLIEALMIFYLGTENHLYTMGKFLDLWRPSSVENVRVMSYRELLSQRRLPRGTIVFSDIERLTESQRPLLTRVHRRLARWGGRGRVLNHPSRSLRRYDLLRKLHELGLNSFNVYRLDELPDSCRWPVFLRLENDHLGPRTPLLDGPEQLRSALRDSALGELNRDDLLAVEFCQTADSDGLCRKYGAFYVAGRVIPRHVFCDTELSIKYEAVVTPGTREEERIFLRTNPHAEEIKRIFELANIDYGRIDYGFKDGRMQVWEINTNPMLLVEPDHYRADRMPDQQCFADQMVALFREIDAEYDATTVGTRLIRLLRNVRRGRQDR